MAMGRIFKLRHLCRSVSSKKRPFRDDTEFPPDPPDPVERDRPWKPLRQELQGTGPSEEKPKFQTEEFERQKLAAIHELRGKFGHDYFNIAHHILPGWLFKGVIAPCLTEPQAQELGEVLDMDLTDPRFRFPRINSVPFNRFMGPYQASRFETNLSTKVDAARIGIEGLFGATTDQGSEYLTLIYRSMNSRRYEMEQGIIASDYKLADEEFFIVKHGLFETKKYHEGLNNLPNKPFELKEPRISSSKNYWARSLLGKGNRIDIGLSNWQRVNEAGKPDPNGQLWKKVARKVDRATLNKMLDISTDDVNLKALAREKVFLEKSALLENFTYY